MEGKSSLGYQAMSPYLILSKIPLKELILSFFPKSHGYSTIQAGLLSHDAVYSPLHTGLRTQ